MAHLSSDEFAEVQHLHECFRNKCEEEMQLLEELTKARLETQAYRLRLAACGVHDASVIPTNLRCGGHREETGTMEIRNLVEWLAKTCPFQDPVVFDVGAPVQVGTHEAFLGRMISWPLQEAGQLKLSVPQCLEVEIKELIQRASRGLLEPRQLLHFASKWDMVGAEVAGEGSTKPAIFLIHQESKETVVIGAWPCVQPVVKASFDPDEYFKSLGDKPAEAAFSFDDSAKVASPTARGPISDDSSIKPPLLPMPKEDCIAETLDQRRRSMTKSRSADQLHQ